MNDSGIHGVHESTPNMSLNYAKARLKSMLPSPIVPLRSSTLNDSLADGVEQLHLKFTPLLLPPPPPPGCPSAPTSPTDFIKNHHESMKKTPIKCATSAKLGSPERNELISGRRPTAARAWTITPRVERSSPAKKRLFGGVVAGAAAATATTRRSSPLAVLAKLDPVSVLMHKRNLPHVVRKIFGQLQDKDLYNCRRVSATWRAAVDSFPALRRSALDFGLRVELNKENPSSLQRWLHGDGVENQRPAKSEVKDKFIQLGQNLKENLHLRKCPRCQNPQIIEYNIGQCQDPDCGYICCLKCNSYTLDGAESFVDKCNSGAFDIGTACKRRTLMDSPPQSQFFFAASTPSCGDAGNDISHLYANVSKDSCYYSYEDASGDSALGNSSSLSVSNGQRDAKKRSLEMLERSGKRASFEAPPRAAIAHAQQADERAKRPARSLYTPVRPICKSPSKHVEESPVKDYSAYKGAGTTASKKRLKRLLR